MDNGPFWAMSRSADIFSVNTKKDTFINLTFSSRTFLYHLSVPKVQLTNPNCALKTEIVCDRRPGQVTFQLLPTIAEQVKVKKINFNTENLSVLELLQLTNKFVTVHAPKDEPLNVVKTKSEKKAGKKR